MGKYFYDTEFLEGTQDKQILGFTYGKTKPTIDLISIAIVSEDKEKQYYAISKDFNIREAWFRCDLCDCAFPIYWIRDNVLKTIWDESQDKFWTEISEYGLKSSAAALKLFGEEFTFKNFKKLINYIGKSNEQIANDVKWYLASWEKEDQLNPTDYAEVIAKGKEEVFYKNVELYGYYADYNHVVFSWLFGKMINLPKGFPMYSRDLKQMLDEVQNMFDELSRNNSKTKYFKLNYPNVYPDVKSVKVKDLAGFPKSPINHSALQDGLWGADLYKFLTSPYNETSTKIN